MLLLGRGLCITLVLGRWIIISASRARRAMLHWLSLLLLLLRRRLLWRLLHAVVQLRGIHLWWRVRIWVWRLHVRRRVVRSLLCRCW